MYSVPFHHLPGNGTKLAERNWFKFVLNPQKQEGVRYSTTGIRKDRNPSVSQQEAHCLRSLQENFLLHVERKREKERERKRAKRKRKDVRVQLTRALAFCEATEH